MATAIHQKTVVGVFNSVNDAQQAVRELESEGIPRDEISLVANKNAVGYETMDPADRDKTADVVADAGIGAAIGGVGGLLLAAAGAVTIPVIGPILAAGPIAAALTGAGIGAAAGGLIGALTESGIPETDAKYYAEGVRRGDVLVTVRADETRVDRVCDVLDRHNAVDVDERVENWQSRGWSGYREDASPFTDEELRAERRYYGPVGGGTMTGLEGMAVDRARSTLETQGRPSAPSTEAGNLTGDIVGTTGMTGAGLGGTTSSSSRTWDDRSLTEKAGDKMRELRDEARETSQGMKTSSTSRQMGDAMDEMGRDLKEAGRDVKDFATGKTGKQAHDYAEEAREAERRRRARVYDRH